MGPHCLKATQPLPRSQPVTLVSRDRWVCAASAGSGFSSHWFRYGGEVVASMRLLGPRAATSSSAPCCPRSPAELSGTIPAVCKPRNPSPALWHAAGEARRFVAVLAPAYVPRRPTETVLYGMSSRTWSPSSPTPASTTTAGCPATSSRSSAPICPAGCFSAGFARAHCDACGHDLLVAFSCKSRTACPSCAGGAWPTRAPPSWTGFSPDVPVRQYVLSLPFELRKLAAFKADVLTALGRIFVEAIFASYSARAKRNGLGARSAARSISCRAWVLGQPPCTLSRLVLDGVLPATRQRGVVFHPAAPPTRDGAGRDRAARAEASGGLAAAARPPRGSTSRGPLNEPPVQTAIDGCASIAMGRGRTEIRPGQATGGTEDARCLLATPPILSTVLRRR